MDIDHSTLRFRVRRLFTAVAWLATPFVVAAAPDTFKTSSSGETALDRYVAAPDPAYRFDLVRSESGKGFEAHILNLTSQTWLTTDDVNRTTWRHWLKIVVPTDVKHSTALLFIGGGSNRDRVPKGVDERLAKIAVLTRSVVVELKMVPNQPLVFAGDGKARTEDSLIAYGWDKFLRTGDPIWLARLPMTKSAVRAMDAVQSFCRDREAGAVSIEAFVVAGGSKRGWTTWTTAAVDKRVAAVIPMVIDMLNVEPSFRHHYSVYGFYAPAVKDYVEMNIMQWQGTPEYDALREIVEPFEYRNRLTMPKFIINASGDQFFLPDSSQFYFDRLPGVKYLRYVPNADHSLSGSDAIETLLACYHAILNEARLPEFSWTIDRAGTIQVTCGETPKHVALWSAHNPETRDFRVDTIGKTWKETRLQPDSTGRYSGRAPEPDSGWSAYFVEVTFPSSAPAPFKFTTEVRVTPQRLPHEFKVADPLPRGFLNGGDASEEAE